MSVFLLFYVAIVTGLTTGTYYQSAEKLGYPQPTTATTLGATRNPPHTRPPAWSDVCVGVRDKVWREKRRTGMKRHCP